MSWAGRRALVTGATGMVGAWLTRALLERGADVVAFVLDADPQSELLRSGDLRRCSVVNGSLEDFWSIERAVNQHEVDTVFHLGAQTLVPAALRSPLQTFEANIRGTYHVLEACRWHHARLRRVVIASSDKAYGDHGGRPYDEVMPLQGRHPYDVSKSCGDLIAQAYHHSYGLPVTIARCGNVYGGGDLNWSRIIPGTIRSLLRGQAPIIRSDGTLVRDYLYVKDAAAAYLTLGELDDAVVAGEAFNFSTEQAMTVLDVVRMVQKLLGCEGVEPEIVNTAVNEIPEQTLSAARARTLLGWRPGHDFESGLHETIEWYRAYLG